MDWGDCIDWSHDRGPRIPGAGGIALTGVMIGAQGFQGRGDCSDWSHDRGPKGSRDWGDCIDWSHDRGPRVPGTGGIALTGVMIGVQGFPGLGGLH